MSVDTAAGPLPITARVLQPPKLKYGPGSRQPTIVCLFFPNLFCFSDLNEATQRWFMEYVSLDVSSQLVFHKFNRMDKKFFKPADIKTWVVVSYESQRRFSESAAKEMVAGLVNACGTVGEFL